MGPHNLQISISSSTVKNVPTYNLKVTITPKSSASPTTIDISRPFNQWFDSQGFFVAAPFQEMLVTSVPTVGKLDGKRLAGGNKTAGAVQGQGQGDYDPEVLDALLAEKSGATGAEAAAKKASKRRKA